VGRIIEASKNQDIVVIDKGGFDKLAVGMVFNVYRENELIGKVSVSDIENHVAGAVIVSNKYQDQQFINGDMVVLAD
jgi:hypothetical protein